MTEHVHEWDVTTDGAFATYDIFCAFRDCNARLEPEQVITMLNEYETLKAATERTSASDAMLFVNYIVDEFGDDPWLSRLAGNLRAYASILEGKDE